METMKQKRLGVILIIASVLLFACSNLQPTPTKSPEGSSEPTQESISTPVVKLEGKDIFCPTQNEEAQKLYNDAGDLQQNGKFAEAQKLYERAIELDPKYCDAMDNLGQILRQQNKIDEAILWYKKSLEVKPDNTVALQNLALAYNFQGETQKAIETYEALTKIAPENPEGYFGLGSIYYRLEQPEKAISYLLTAEKLYTQESSPYVTDAQYYLGFSYFTLQDCTNAKKYFEPIYNQFSNDGGINYVLGVCYLQSEPKDVNVARTYIQKAQEAGIQIPSEILSAINGQ